MSKKEEKKTVNVTVKNLPQSAQKLRLVVNLVKDKDVDEALDIMKFTNKKGTKFVTNAIKSAIASAKDKFGWDDSTLYISSITADEAQTLMRARYSARGRASRIFKRRSHLNLELSQRK